MLGCGGSIEWTQQPWCSLRCWFGFQSVKLEVRIGTWNFCTFSSNVLDISSHVTSQIVLLEDSSHPRDNNQCIWCISVNVATTSCSLMFPSWHTSVYSIHDLVNMTCQRGHPLTLYMFVGNVYMKSAAFSAAIQPIYNSVCVVCMVSKPERQHDACDILSALK